MTIHEKTFGRIFFPEANPFDSNAMTVDGVPAVLDTHGRDFEYVKEIYAQAPDRVWTIVETGNGKLRLTNGLHWINRLGYVISKKPFSSYKGEPYLEVFI